MPVTKRNAHRRKTFVSEINKIEQNRSCKIELTIDFSNNLTDWWFKIGKIKR